MARSNKPILWLPFAGGGLVAALIVPVLILITGRPDAARHPVFAI